MQGIYLDHNATTPVLSDVIDAMLPFFRRCFGNPSSAHASGVEARNGIERARSQVARLVGAPASHVLFTSSATEAINTAFHSACWSRRKTQFQIVVSAVEHAAVRQCAQPTYWDSEFEAHSSISAVFPPSPAPLTDFDNSVPCRKMQLKPKSDGKTKA